MYYSIVSSISFLVGKVLQAESSASNENVPYCLNYIDNPGAGTYTYSVKYVTGSSSFQFGEAGGNHITLLELGAWSAGSMPVSKGGTGATSYTNGSVLFSDGSNITENNSKLFFDNTNYRLGIGASSPREIQHNTITSNGSGLLLNNTLGGSGASVSLDFNTYSTTSIGFANYSASIKAIDDGAYSSHLSFLTKGNSVGAAQSEKMRLTSGGNVGIGTTTPAAKLDVSGDVNTSGNYKYSDGSSTAKMKSGYVDAGTFLQLDNIKATVTTSGYRGLSVAAVSTPFYCNIGATFGAYGGNAGGNSAYNYYAGTTPSSAWFGWGFNNAGDYSTYLVNDMTNNRTYRISLSIGPSYLNNFITIERLY